MYGMAVLRALPVVVALWAGDPGKRMALGKGSLIARNQFREWVGDQSDESEHSRSDNVAALGVPVDPFDFGRALFGGLPLRE